MRMPKINLKLQGEIRQFDGPQVMGIINATPDSFWEGSRTYGDADSIKLRTAEIIIHGGTMIDVGAYSTRPGAPEVSEQEEMDRLGVALQNIRFVVGDKIPISIDTFRASVAETCIREFGASIINDISGGTLDPEMIPLVARTEVPYILTHMRGTPQTMQKHTNYPNGVTKSVAHFFQKQINEIAKINPEAVNQVILDPGFGFAKTLKQNYQLFHDLPQLMEQFPQYPMLIGVSRKSMIYKLLETDPTQALNGTTVLHTFALLNGAAILRVHDVKEAVEAVQIVQQLQ